jgi:hypothetical protein
VKSKNQKKRDPAELLKMFKKLCPTKGSGIESVTILRRGTNGFEALVTLTEESERQFDDASKNKPGMNNQEDIHKCVAQLLRLIHRYPGVVAPVLYGCFRQVSGEGCVVDHKRNQEG